jgi:ABC-type proline/glycine betaine transport system substrate-binding protein
MNRPTLLLLGSLVLLCLVSIVYSQTASTFKCFSDAVKCSGKPITLLESNWLGSSANVAVAKILIEEKLGRCTQSLLSNNDDEHVIFMSENSVPAVMLEVWPEGKRALIEKVITLFTLEYIVIN